MRHWIYLGLAIATVGFLIVIALWIAGSWAPVPKTSHRKNMAHPDASGTEQQSAIPAASGAYAVAPLFTPGRIPAAAQDAATAPVMSIPRAPLPRVWATLQKGSDKRWAVVSDQQSGVAQTVTIGATVAGWKVDEIAETWVLFSRDGIAQKAKING